MENREKLSRNQLIILAVIAGLALAFFYSKAKDSCVAELKCENNYCLSTRKEVEASCARKLLIIYSVPIVLASHLASVGIMFVANKLFRKESNNSESS